MKINRKFTPEEVGLIHRTMMPGASPDDVKVFVATCERTGLDPFAKQIMPTSRNTQRNGSWVTIWGNLTTVDGLRKIAVDTGEYEGQEGPFWCGPDAAWKDLWTSPEAPFASKVLVHRKGFRTGLSGIARYDAFVQKKKDGQPNQVWSTMPDHMTGKCAEALALRRAFPNEMAGLYTEEEAGAAEIIQATVDEAHEETRIEWTDEEREAAKNLVSDLAEILLASGYTEDETEKRLHLQKNKIGDVEVTYGKWCDRAAALAERIQNEIKTKKEQTALADELAQHPA